MTILKKIICRPVAAIMGMLRRVKKSAAVIMVSVTIPRFWPLDGVAGVALHINEGCES